METIWIIVFLSVTFLLFILAFFTYLQKQEKKHMDGEHHCNFCECSFIYTKKDLSRTYCPYCGNKLTKHKLHPDFCESLRQEENENDGNGKEENSLSNSTN